MIRRPNTSLAANPILVGASALLIAIVGVFLAYNANTGLPFVPTYEVTAVVRDADQLTANAEVRIGGKRVGILTGSEAEILPGGIPVSRLALKLDRTVSDLPVDTRVRVRPRSIIGLKYIELTPGTSNRTIASGGVVPLSGARSNVDLQDALDAFDEGTRAAVGTVTRELGDGLAGRGAELNRALTAFDPLTRHLGPVMANLAAPETDLSGLLRGLDSAMAAAAPVAVELGGLFDGAATTLHAVARVDDSFAALIEEVPRAERDTSAALREIRPVLTRATRLVDALGPGVALLPKASRRLSSALATGTPVIANAGALADRLRATLAALRALVRDPATAGSVIGLTRTLRSLVPTVRYLLPLQERCNYLGLYERNAASTVGEGDSNGNWFRFMPLQNTPDNPYRGKVPEGLHFDPYASTGQDGHCTAGNELFVPGTQIGDPPNASTAPTRNPATLPPAEARP